MDKQGNKGRAITCTKSYRKSLQLVQLYQVRSKQGLRARAIAYQERIKPYKVLSRPLTSEWKWKRSRESGVEKPHLKESKPRRAVVTEKPNTLGRRCRLRNCQESSKEAIVYPVQRPDLFPYRLATWYLAIWSPWLR